MRTLIPASLLLAAVAVWADDTPQLKMFKPLPGSMESQSNPITQAKIDLGRMLYYEPRLSRSQDISCNSCHDLATYGVDRLSSSDGFKGQKGSRNAPTVYNAAGHFLQFWDGRATDVEQQAKGPVMNPVEMAMASNAAVTAVLKSIPGYVSAFKQAFPGEPDPVTFDNMALAIGAFERGLVTPSRWDKFLEGDQTALSQAEKNGLNAFLNAGCQSCHAGAYLGGQTFQKLGVAQPYPDMSDAGRKAVTKLESDLMVFKVPSLRNIEMTGPYFHNGKVETLQHAVKAMGEHQLGEQLSEQEIASIVTFLKLLTGEIPSEYIRRPQLPAGTQATPRPDKG